MGRSQETFGKKEKEQKRMKKRQDKAKRKDMRKSSTSDGSLDSMIAYVDENGRIVDTPPDLTKKTKIKAENIEISVPKKEDIEEPIRTGRVEFFNDDKGYGFIKDLDTQEKFFVHVHGLLDKIEEGNKVNFELERGLKGMNAVRVKKV
ncbi:cold-shock DNA-binding protein family [Saccharicrinis carchari]|uniref:Cold-shock DNA-binding protein family n=1 Tax=Saccharicrinis carchari TaxID=1168039 RepID=A0A521EQQ3_SACCC|nr:cold shock domain-containing protein [Saccharicrinis carchari]SMO86273.1 cold-shock DNA-binding protein family [Saccharicrinis carchari]